MRTLYWSLFLVALVMVGAGLWAFSSPPSTVVLADLLDQWYRQKSLLSLAVGACVGLLAGLGGTSRLRHRPNGPASAFLNQVAGIGIAAAVAAAIVAILLSSWLAYGAEFGPLSPAEKVELVALSGIGRFAALIGASIAASLLVFAVVTRVRTWGGQYSLLEPSYVPNLGR